MLRTAPPAKWVCSSCIVARPTPSAGLKLRTHPHILLQISPSTRLTKIASGQGLLLITRIGSPQPFHRALASRQLQLFVKLCPTRMDPWTGPGCPIRYLIRPLYHSFDLGRRYEGSGWSLRADTELELMCLSLPRACDGHLEGCSSFTTQALQSLFQLVFKI